MNGYLIPANAKKGTLILNIFRPIDLIIFGTGIGISLLALSIVSSSNIVAVAFALAPGCICALLVTPVANYHNVLCAIGSIIKFYTERRSYRWKGWCLYDKFKDDGTNSKA